MTRSRNTSVYRIVGVYMILVALINLASQFAVFDSNTGQPQDIVENEVGVDETVPSTLEEEAVQDVGGITTPMGMMNLAHFPVMLVIGIGMLLVKPWEIFAILAIAVDGLVKGANILSQLAIGQSLLDAALIPALFIVLDLVAIYLIYQQWQARKEAPTESRPERERVEA